MLSPNSVQDIERRRGTALENGSAATPRPSTADGIVATLRDIIRRRGVALLLPLLASVLFALTIGALAIALPPIVATPIAVGVAVPALILAWISGVWERDCLAHESKALADITRMQTQKARRIALFESDALLYASWYLTLRLREEVERARRYGQPLSLLVLAPRSSRRGAHDRAGLADALRQQIRASDLAGALPDDRVGIVLPNTGVTEVRQTKRRLQPYAARFGYAVGTATQTGEEANSEELMKTALDTVHRRQKREQQRAA